MKVLQKKDPDVAIVKGVDDEIVATTKQQLPTDLDDLKEDWVKYDCDTKSFRSNIPEGKTRRFTGTALIATNSTPRLLLDRTELALDKLNVIFEFKEIQKLDMRKDLMIMGTANSLAPKEVKKVVQKILKAGGQRIRKKRGNVGSRVIYAPDFLADFEIVKDFPDNTPFRARKAGERVPLWQKQCLHLECEPGDIPELKERAMAAAETGLWKRFFGENAWFAENPGPSCGASKKDDFGRMVNRHGSINLCLGSVRLPGLEDCDVVCNLEMQADEEGEHNVIKRSVRDIMMGTKHEGLLM